MPAICLFLFLLGRFDLSVTVRPQQESATAAASCLANAIVHRDIQLSSGNVDVALSRSGKYIATTAETGKVAVWDLETGELLTFCQPAQAAEKNAKWTYKGWPAGCLKFAADSDALLYFASADGVHQWRWKTKSPPTFLVAAENYGLGQNWHEEPLTIDASADGKHLAFVDLRNNVFIVDIKRKEISGKVMIARDIADENSCRSFRLFFSRDSSFIVYTDGCRIKTCTLSGQHRATLLTPQKQGCVDYICGSNTSAKGCFSTSAGEIFLLHLATGKEELLAKGHTGFCHIAFSPDDSLLAVADSNRLLAVYSVKDKRRLCETKGPKGGFTGVGFLKDGKTVFAIGDYPIVRFWSLSEPAKLVEKKR